MEEAMRPVLTEEQARALIDMAKATEREACARVADYYADHSRVARNIAAAIRNRKEPA